LAFIVTLRRIFLVSTTVMRLKDMNSSKNANA